MKLTASKREEKTKGENNKIRREGHIPAVLYGVKQENQNIFVDGPQYHAAIRSMKQGGLSTMVFELEVEGKKVKAIVKQVQYHPTTYDVMHLDFLALDDKVEVCLKVPIRIVGKGDCIGVKEGGVLRQIIRAIKVKCLPSDIPEEFFLPVQDIKMMGSKALDKLEFPKGVKPMARLSEVVAIVAKR